MAVQYSLNGHPLKDVLNKRKQASFARREMLSVDSFEHVHPLYEQPHCAEDVVPDGLDADEQHAAQKRHGLRSLALVHLCGEAPDSLVVKLQCMLVVVIEPWRAFEARSRVVRGRTLPRPAGEGGQILRMLV